MNAYNTGFLLGKFMPPTIGHVHLAGFACNVVKDMTIVVETRDSDPVPGDLRVKWMRELFPQAKVFRLHKDMPQSPSEHPDFWNLWKETLMLFTEGKSPDIVFASDDYGKPLAECLGARFFPLDPGREAVDISATRVRDNPYKNWRFISHPAREFYARKFSFIGPESTGKSTIVKEMAKVFKTVFVREFAANLLQFQKGFLLEDAVDSVIAQKADIKISSRLCNGNLFVDSDALTTKIWCQKLFNQVPDMVEREVENENFEHTFLFSPDSPYIEDVHRKPEWKQFRYDMFFAMEQELIANKRPYTVISGDWKERKIQVYNSLKTFIKK